MVRTTHNRVKSISNIQATSMMTQVFKILRKAPKMLSNLQPPALARNVWNETQKVLKIAAPREKSPFALARSARVVQVMTSGLGESRGCRWFTKMGMHESLSAKRSLSSFLICLIRTLTISFDFPKPITIILAQNLHPNPISSIVEIFIYGPKIIPTSHHQSSKMARSAPRVNPVPH